MGKSIEFQHSVDISASPARVFDLIDDLPRTPEWLARCVALERVSPPGETAVGQKLRYAYREGRRTGQMDGEVTERLAGERLTCRYTDELMEVVVDFRVHAADSGARLTHGIAITPKSLFGRLFSPFIRGAIAKQTTTAMEALKTLAVNGRP